MRVKQIVFGTFCLCALFAADAFADPIPFNDVDWFRDPEVTLSDPILGGFATATLTEDFPLTILIENDPGLGDPTLIPGGLDETLMFDWEFTEGAGNIDEFFFVLFDADLGQVAGDIDTLLVDSTSSGTYMFDLSGLPVNTFGYGMSFQLNALDSDIDSVAVVTNLKTTANVTGVPEPSALVLLVAGAILLRRRLRRAS